MSAVWFLAGLVTGAGVTFLTLWRKELEEQSVKVAEGARDVAR